MNIKEEIIKKTNVGFTAANDFKIIELTNEKAVIEYEVKESGLNPYNIVHGGMLYALADTTAGVLSCMSGRPSLTISASINYLKAANCKKVIATAKILKEGKNIGYYEVEIHDENKNLLTVVSVNMFFINNDK